MLLRAVLCLILFIIYFFLFLCTCAETGERERIPDVKRSELRAVGVGREKSEYTTDENTTDDPSVL